MRIVVVSAHYPPEFVSGGTLVPQRLARGLAARHEVHVYAGSLDQRRAPLETWEEKDPTGLPVRWIASWPWTGWSDRHNYDNAAVAADFGTWLATIRPDVVHLHSLQTLGCGMVEAAAAAGAVVVVTMHDFWWICARQFLADRSYRPCCLVVSAGVCECEVDRPWLAERSARLTRALEGADLILVPSSSAAAVLRANGVAPDRLAVDANGLPGAGAVPPAPAVPAVPPVPPAPAVPGRLRMVYAGGPDRMKGVDVLLAAATRLADRDGWQLTGYGMDPATVPAGLPIDAQPPFPEDQLSAVLAQADLLVVPSVMRETFSILTREALACGVPVLATDTLGPEEVVVDGHNGLIVPAADPAAMAHAVGRLLDDPALLARFRQATGAVAIRSIEDQVAANESRYRDLVDRRAGPAGPAAPRPSHPGIGNVVFAVGIQGAPLRYRARLPAEGLALAGINTSVVHYRDPDLPRLLAGADAAVFYRVPATTQVLDLIAACRRRRCPVLFDVDDLIFDPDLAPEIPALSILAPAECELWLEGVRRYRTTMEACDVFVGSTDQLCRHATMVTGMPAERFANGVGMLLGRVSDQALRAPRPGGPPRIGYFSGTTTHDRDWGLIEPVVIDAMDRHRDLELWLVGLLKPSPALDRHRDRVRTVPMVPWAELPALLRAVDLNLVPLEPGSRFNEAKSAIKWLEAALVETPTMASPTQPYREVIVPGQTGILATSLDDWAAGIDRLVDDPDELARQGTRARRASLLDWSPELQGQRYLAVVERAVERAAGGAVPRPPGTPWVPVALDEPAMAVTLEGYETGSSTAATAPAPAVPGVPPLAGRVRGVIRRSVEMLRRDGISMTNATRAARLIDRRRKATVDAVRSHLARRR